MTTVRFTDLAGNTAQCEVWSPGPVPRSVWALMPDGTAVAVHRDTKIQIDVDHVSDPRTELCPGHSTYIDGRWAETPGVGKKHECRQCAVYAQARYLSRFRYGPAPILSKEWARVELFRVDGPIAEG